MGFCIGLGCEAFGVAEPKDICGLYPCALLELEKQIKVYLRILKIVFKTVA